MYVDAGSFHHLSYSPSPSRVGAVPCLAERAYGIFILACVQKVGEVLLLQHQLSVLLLHVGENGVSSFIFTHGFARNFLDILLLPCSGRGARSYFIQARDEGGHKFGHLARSLFSQARGDSGHDRRALAELVLSFFESSKMLQVFLHGI